MRRLQVAGLPFAGRAGALLAVSDPSQYPGLALAALEWLVRRDHVADNLARWDVGAHGWPVAPEDAPVFAVDVPAMFAAVPMTGEALARALRRQFDPEEAGPWRFVAAPVSGAAVWLVHEPTVTRRT